MANAARATMTENRATNMSPELQDEQEATMESHGVPRIVQLKIKDKEKEDLEDEPAFFDSSEEDLSPTETSDEDCESSESDSDDQDTECNMIMKGPHFRQPRNPSEEENLYAILRSQPSPNRTDGQNANRAANCRGRLNVMRSLFQPEAEWLQKLTHGITVPSMTVRSLLGRRTPESGCRPRRRTNAQDLEGLVSLLLDGWDN